MIRRYMDEVVVSKDSIEKKLARLKIDKSPGIDQLHPRVLSEIRKSYFIPVMSYL